MAAGSDVIVVGGGIIGCAVARELSVRGLEVRLLERRGLAGGATQASAGMLAPFIEGHSGGDFLGLAVRSLDLFDAFVDGLRDTSGVDVEYRRPGSLEIARDERSARQLHGPGTSARPRREWLNGAAAIAAEPWLDQDVHGALLIRDHGYVGVESLTLALAGAARRAGTMLQTGVDVVSVRPRGAELSVGSADGEEWSARHVVAAAGSWSGSGRPWGRELADVFPVRGQIVRVRAEPSAIRHVVWGPACYVVPWRDGTVLIGATEERVGYDERVTADGVSGLLRAAATLLPPLGGATFVEARAGLRPATSDGLPIIGPSAEVPGLVFATGHFRNGVLLAPLTARLVAECVTGAGSDPALALTRPGRASLSQPARRHDQPVA